ncbi:hypothetical protein [Caballeronia sp. KNU42]
MNPVLQAILHDQHAGRAGTYRFDPATGQRSPLTDVQRSTNPTDFDEPATRAIEVDPESGLSDMPDTGATKSDFSDS